MGMFTNNEQETIDALMAVGFPPRDIPALMGNIDVETGGSYSHTQKERGGKGYGLFQFTGSHKRDYFDWLKDSNLSDNKTSQAKFVFDNIYGNRGYGRELGWRDRSKLQTMFSESMLANPHIDDPIKRKAKIFSDVYEKPGTPHNERRMESAKNWEQKLASTKKPPPPTLATGMMSSGPMRRGSRRGRKRPS